MLCFAVALVTIIGKKWFSKTMCWNKFPFGFHLKGWWIYNVVCLVYLTLFSGIFSTPISSREMPTDCRSCCRGGNATRIEPSWATKLWLWESSIWLRYWATGTFLSHRLFPFSALPFLLSNIFVSKPANHSAPTVIDMALGVSVAERAVLCFTSFQMIHAHHTYCCVRLLAIWSWLHMHYSEARTFSNALQK